jgi:hypothetical protein
VGGTEGEARERGIRDSLGWEYNERRGPAGRLTRSLARSGLCWAVFTGTYGTSPHSASTGNGLAALVCAVGIHGRYYRDKYFTKLRYVLHNPVFSYHECIIIIYSVLFEETVSLFLFFLLLLLLLLFDSIFFKKNWGILHLPLSPFLLTINFLPPVK